MGKKMSKILSYLDSIKLTLAQWGIVSVVTIIGGLVALLKLQGSRLHKAQIKLLDQNFTYKLDTAAKNTKNAGTAYQTAKDAYLNAGGTLLLMLCLVGSQVRGDDLLPKCQYALSACDTLVKTQQTENTILKNAVEQWKKEAVKGEQSELQSFPWYIWVGMGILTGITVGRSFK